MGSHSRFLSLKSHSVFVYLIAFFSLISTYISRFRMFGCSKNNVRDIVCVGAESEAVKERVEKSELHLRFNFPSFEEFSRRGNSFNSDNINKFKFASGKNSVTAFIEVLTSFPLREIDDDKIGAIEFQEKVENKAELVEESRDFLDFYWEENGDGFLSDGDFGDEMEINDENGEIGLEKEEIGDCLVDNEESDHIIKKVEEHDLSSDFLCDGEFGVGGFAAKDDIEKSEQNEALVSDSWDPNKLESLWEHQELIEQLQMELRKVRATGLPTIFEESESPKMMDDLKLWKIDENLQHKDCMGELHKAYKSYKERMRKFDILNYQKMYAMGFLQLKDPFRSTSQQKPSVPTLKSLVTQNLWLYKHKSRGSDPIKKFVNEMQGDLEEVYVGQMCLSWEFLHWQYERALDLLNSDPDGIHRYNEVAGEFQQFQVLVQRFTEDEPFQGPRVESYVKSRCVLCNLLQVPLIREDCLEGKKKSRRDEQDIITSEMLVETIEESIRVFWEFVGSDKDCTTTSINSRKKMPELNSPEDLKLLREVRKTLQKKEKKMKDTLRGENCILRKFRHKKEEESEQVLHFFAQVDVKLVARVLNMSKVSRDQLIWCQNKLSKIGFVHRKIHVESAFLLFPS